MDNAQVMQEKSLLRYCFKLALCLCVGTGARDLFCGRQVLQWIMTELPPLNAVFLLYM
jgi:hypothetical protein